jgi:phosphopantothenoylcysteine decarboxylase/phosphopantothenate--cysteine ligase
LAENGINVELVTGITHLKTNHSLIRRVDVKTTAEMYAACHSLADSVDIIIMAAAVADYTPKQTIDKKLKKADKSLTIDLKPTVDILKTLVDRKKKHQIIVGFALETDHEIENAKHKLHKKKLDYIILNSLNDEGAGFGVTTNKVSLIDANELIVEIPLQSKKLVADEIVKHLLSRIKL